MFFIKFGTILFCTADTLRTLNDVKINVVSPTDNLVTLLSTL